MIKQLVEEKNDLEARHVSVVEDSSSIGMALIVGRSNGLQPANELVRNAELVTSLREELAKLQVLQENP